MSRIALRKNARRNFRARRPIIPALALGVLSVVLAAAIVYYMIGFPKDVEKAVYPLSYEELIDRYAAQYALDPARVAAVIYCESSFRSDAVSSAGARGLMQIMPDTGGWIAKKLDEENYTDDLLFDPEVNIRYGCWYLNYLDNRFGADLTKATAAYHAGGGRVDEWLETPAYSSDGVTLSEIPYEQTRRYVENVRLVYEKYKEIMKA